MLLLQPLLWIGISIAIHALATNALLLTDGAPPRWQRELARALYCLGIPLLALGLRVLDGPADLGLVAPTRPMISLAALLIVGAGAASAILLVERAGAGLPPAGRPGFPPAEPLAWASWHALLQETHWAFFRAAALSLALPAAIAGSLGLRMAIALGLLALEAATSPTLRHAMHDASTARPHARAAALAVASALLFTLTGSSLVAFLAHLLVLTLLAAYGALESRPPAGRERGDAGEAPPRVEPTVV